MRSRKKLMRVYWDKNAPKRLRVLALLLRDGYTVKTTAVNGIHEDLSLSTLETSELLTLMNQNHDKLIQDDPWNGIVSYNWQESFNAEERWRCREFNIRALPGAEDKLEEWLTHYYSRKRVSLIKRLGAALVFGVTVYAGLVQIGIIPPSRPWRSLFGVPMVPDTTTTSPSRTPLSRTASTATDTVGSNTGSDTSATTSAVDTVTAPKAGGI